MNAKKNKDELNKVINNTNIKQNTILIIIETNPELITSEINNDIDDKMNVNILNTLNILDMSYILNILDMAIQDIDTKSIAGESNNDTNDKIDIDVLDVLSAAIKNMDIKPITSKTNNNMNVKVDISIFISRISSKINTKLIVDKLYKANIIIRKKIYKSNLF